MKPKGSPLTLSQIVKNLEARAPAATAADWDPVGLLVGDPRWKTRGAVVSIDLTQEAIEQAEKLGYRLIVNHHPCIFPKSRGLSRLVPGSSSGGLAVEALTRGIAVYSSHTNFDQCSLEVVRTVSQGLGCEPKGRLIDLGETRLLKLVVYVPEAHASKVRDAICEAGAGQIGEYDFCTFSSPGEGTFRGSPSSRPFLGQPGRLEHAQELRVETILPEGLKDVVLAALFEAHPYEEVAYDLYAVEQHPASRGLVKGLGYGFWGEFSRPQAFSEIARRVRSLFKVDGFWLTPSEPSPARISRVAFVAGKGASFVSAAQQAGVELFITGEAGYHVALDGSRRGVSVLELGHRESERFFVSTMEGWLKESGLKTKSLLSSVQKISFEKRSER